eukprot:TRINITY_DN3039_c0_g2_i1.p1 TRINITY_DN3039_c0_g2~~TRINITY_DN3039_c0_g2_i1.p1  ORF type:complete len:551 (+),score=113.94 TRINITY_DN3039_c0_g2_i1:2307-3959(+)
METIDINEYLEHIGNFLSNNSYVDAIKEVGLEFLSSGNIPIIPTDPVFFGVSCALKAISGLIKLYTTHKEVKKQLDEFKFRSCHLLNNFLELAAAYSVNQCDTDPLDQYLKKFENFVVEATTEVQKITERCSFMSVLRSPTDIQSLKNIHEGFDRLLHDLTSLTVSKSFIIIKQLPDRISLMLEENRSELDKTLTAMLTQLQELNLKTDKQTELIEQLTIKLELFPQNIVDALSGCDASCIDYSELIEDKSSSHYEDIHNTEAKMGQWEDNNCDVEEFMLDEEKLITDEIDGITTYTYDGFDVMVVDTNEDEDNKIAVAACVAMKFNHKSICRVFGYTYMDCSWAYVTERFTGTLEEKLKSETSVKNKLSILRQLAKAIDFCHSEGYIHRNICPQNVSIRKDGTIALCNFEKTRDLERGGFNSMQGNVRYMPPSIFATKSLVHPGIDYWSFGAVFFEVLTGAKPYEDYDDYECYQMFLDCISRSGKHKKPFRRPNSYKNMFHYLIFNCPIWQCFNSDPQKRPTFSNIIPILKTLETSIDSMSYCIPNITA